MNTLQRPWGRMAFLDTGGTGIPIIFLHGTGCQASDWRQVMARLSATCRCVAVDFRAHGRSTVPAGRFTLDGLASDVSALADTLGLATMVVAGHSLGGMVAMRVAMRDPRVKGLALFEGWTNLRVAGTAFRAGRFYGQLSPHAVRRIRRQDALTRGRCRPHHWKTFWRSVEDFDATSFLMRSHIPILEVYGALGKTRNTRTKLLIPRRRTITVRWIADAGHYLPQEQPDLVADLCHAMVNRKSLLHCSHIAPRTQGRSAHG